MVKGYKYYQSLCLFLADVVCPFRKGKNVLIPKDRFTRKYCFDCPKFKQFEREMDEEDERVMAEIDREMLEGQTR
jgi:hypothetical protein